MLLKSLWMSVGANMRASD